MRTWIMPSGKSVSNRLWRERKRLGSVCEMIKVFIGNYTLGGSNYGIADENKNTWDQS